MNFQRQQDWPKALVSFIESRRDTAFAWGSQDCCQFARHAVLAVTGSDPSRGWKMRPYRTAKGAAGILKRLGGVEALPALAGLTEIALTLAGRGDVVVCDNEGRPALGVVLGREAAFAAKAGLVFLPVATCRRAWRVG